MVAAEELRATDARGLPGVPAARDEAAGEQDEPKGRRRADAEGSPGEPLVATVVTRVELAVLHLPRP
jgi:hypothetical protein